MKITISIAELTTLVRNTYNLPDDTRVIVSKKAIVGENKQLNLLGNLLTQAVVEYPGTVNKIAAIKRFRELGAENNIAIGLYEAKVAVEDPQTAMDNFKKRGSILSNRLT